MVMPDRFVDQASPDRMYEAAGLDADGIVKTVFAAFGRADDATVTGANIA